MPLIKQQRWAIRRHVEIDLSVAGGRSVVGASIGRRPL
jgi:hypothetical protein